MYNNVRTMQNYAQRQSPEIIRKLSKYILLCYVGI